MTARVLGVISLVALIGVCALDFTGEFWVEHPMFAAVLAAVLVAAVGAAFVDRYIARRDAARWQLVAALALGDMHTQAEAVWRGLLNAVGDEHADTMTAPDVREHAIQADLSPRIFATARSAEGRADLLAVARDRTDEAGEALGRWGAIMLQGGEHADDLNAYVALFGRLFKLRQVLEDEEAGKPLELGEDWVAQRTAKLIDLGAQTDEEFMVNARELAPVQSWIGAPDWLREPARA